MAIAVGPPRTPTSQREWTRVVLASGRAVLVYRTPTGACSYILEQPSLARDAAGLPQVALTLLLSRMPALSEPSIAPLVVGGSLASTCTYCCAPDELAALREHCGVACSPLFVQH